MYDFEWQNVWCIYVQLYLHSNNRKYVNSNAVSKGTCNVNLNFGKYFKCVKIKEKEMTVTFLFFAVFKTWFLYFFDGWRYTPKNWTVQHSMHVAHGVMCTVHFFVTRCMPCSKSFIVLVFNK